MREGYADPQRATGLLAGIADISAARPGMAAQLRDPATIEMLSPENRAFLEEVLPAAERFAETNARFDEMRERNAGILDEPPLEDSPLRTALVEQALAPAHGRLSAENVEFQRQAMSRLGTDEIRGLTETGALHDLKTEPLPASYGEAVRSAALNAPFDAMRERHAGLPDGPPLESTPEREALIAQALAPAAGRLTPENLEFQERSLHRLDTDLLEDLTRHGMLHDLSREPRIARDAGAETPGAARTAIPSAGSWQERRAEFLALTPEERQVLGAARREDPERLGSLGWRELRDTRLDTTHEQDLAYEGRRTALLSLDPGQREQYAASLRTLSRNRRREAFLTLSPEERRTLLAPARGAGLPQERETTGRTPEGAGRAARPGHDESTPEGRLESLHAHRAALLARQSNLNGGEGPDGTPGRGGPPGEALSRGQASLAAQARAAEQAAARTPRTERDAGLSL